MTMFWDCVKAHGVLMWASIGLLMPIGILVVRLSRRDIARGAMGNVKTWYYIHLFVQGFAVILATVGAVISLVKFGHEFKYTHQRLGLSIYIVVWLQPLVAIVRPQRGAKGRPMWYFVHWVLGTGAVILGIINIYIGITVYEKITTTSTRTVNILFSIEVSIIGLVYLLQDRWDYLIEQGNQLVSTVIPSAGSNGALQMSFSGKSNGNTPV